MKGKILSLAIIVLMVLGSFGAVGINHSKDDEDVFSEEINELKKIAKEEDWTFDIGKTSVSERNIEELCGFKAPDNWWKNVDFDLITTTQSLPNTFDWRSEGGCTPVKDQGNCGSCWAFGTVAPLESAIKIEEGINVDLSEQWLVSCNRDGWGCDGGWWAHDYHQWKNGQSGDTGAVYESDFPYSASDESCIDIDNHPYRLNDWAFIGSENGIPQRSAIKQAIYTYGPVSAAVRATSLWEFYNGGVFNKDAPGNVNHAVTLVGWDDTKGRDGCWILKNSWGTDWGDDGYMYIEYGCSSIGYSACYVNGYRGPPTDVEEEVTFTFKEITNDPNRGDFEAIDPIFNKPEWYYRLGAEISNEMKYQYDYNIDPDGWWIFQWLSYYTWEPNNDHLFITESPTILFTLKVMEEDLWPNPDDLADVSAKPGGGAKDGADQEKRCAIYHGTYNLVTGEITGDAVSKPDSNGYRTTMGDGNDNAKVWFKIDDTYNEDLYDPELSVSPGKLDFGKKQQGVYSEYISITNDATVDPNDWAYDLSWTASDNKDWISISKSSGDLPAESTDNMEVTVDANKLTKGSTYTGEITIDSNGGSKTIEVKIGVKEKTKSKDDTQIFLGFDLFRQLFLNSIFYRFLEKII